ncbi:phage tail protein, partial [Martelella alba]
MADRIIVYPGAIPLETDILSTNKFSMIGLAKLAAAIMGSTTYLNGLACTPTSPASLSVNVAPGEIYSLQNIDNTAYSSIDADTTHAILKQGILLDAVSLTMTSPITSGMSVNYLVQIAYQDTDSDAVTLPYYNSANPTQAWSGPNNSGAAQNTVRSGVCTVALKTGVTAITGTQVTPSPDTGYVGAYVITVAYGQTTITAANIALASNAPFLPSNGLVSGIQSGALLYAADTGTANAYAVAYSPAITALTDGVKVVFKAKTANTGASTFSPNGLTAYPIYSHANQALQGGEIVANGLIEVEWNSTLTAWVLCGNSGGALPVLAATKTNQAVNLGQLNTSLPIGVPIPWPTDTPPTGWIAMVGQTISQSVYPE